MNAKASLKPMYELPKKGGAINIVFDTVLFLGNKTKVGSLTLRVSGTLTNVGLKEKLNKIPVMIRGLV